MKEITLRIDSRLIHGQVVESWLPALDINSVVVVDSDAANRELAKAAMNLAVPPTVRLEVLDPSKAGLKTWGGTKGVLVLVSSIDTALEFLKAGHIPKDTLLVNLGVMHHEPERHPITPGIHLSSYDLDLLARIESLGFPVEIRSLPSQPMLTIDDARSRLNKAVK